MKRLRSVLVCAGLGIGMLSVSALALPPALERVSDEAMIAVAIADPGKLQTNVQALSKAIGQPVPPEMGFKEMLALGGFSSGVDATKSMAIVIMPPKEQPKKAGAEGEEDMMDLGTIEQRVLMLIPITSYADMLKGFDAKPAGDGKVDMIAMPTGEDGFTKDIGGGYAVVGSDKELVQAYTGKPGDKAFKSRMGKGGNTLADSSDIVALVNVGAMRPMAEEGVKKMKQAAKDQLEGMGQNVDAQMALANWMSETIVRDTEFVVGGMKFSEAGIGMDMLGTFKANSYLAKAFSASGNSSSLLNKLPMQPYLFAGAFDMTSAGIKALMRDITSKAPMPGGEDATKAALAAIDTADGQAGVVGFPMGGMFAGLLTSTVTFTPSKDPNAAAKAIKDGLMIMDKQTVQGMTYASSYTENAAKAGEISLDAWEMKITSDGTNQTGQQGMAMIFGPTGGPTGYIAKVNDGVYRTFAKNTDLMTKAIAAGKGAESVAADAMLKEVQGQLPSKRMAEGYIGSKSVMDMVLPLIAMTGMQVPAGAMPEKMAPIGMALSTEDGSARGTMFVPAGVIKVGVALGEGFQQMQQNGNDGGEVAPNGGKKRDGAGQPKF